LFTSIIVRWVSLWEPGSGTKSMARVLEALISGQMKCAVSEYLEPDVRIIMGHYWNHGWWKAMVQNVLIETSSSISFTKYVPLYNESG
jgi:hypothetical protein